MVAIRRQSRPSDKTNPSHWTFSIPGKYVAAVHAPGLGVGASVVGQLVGVLVVGELVGGSVGGSVGTGGPVGASVGGGVGTNLHLSLSPASQKYSGQHTFLPLQFWVEQLCAETELGPEARATMRSAARDNFIVVFPLLIIFFVEGVAVAVAEK